MDVEKCLGSPADVTGTPFTSVFAMHSGGDDLSTGWTFLDPHMHVWPPLKPTHGYEGACPTIRYVAKDDYYYVLNLHTDPGGYGTFVVRSKDLITCKYRRNLPLLLTSGSMLTEYL